MGYRASRRINCRYGILPAGEGGDRDYTYLTYAGAILYLEGEATSDCELYIILRPPAAGNTGALTSGI